MQFVEGRWRRAMHPRDHGAIQDGSAAVIMPAIRRSFQLPTPFPTAILGYEQPRGTRWD